jgi:hypothetical protein
LFKYELNITENVTPNWYDEFRVNRRSERLNKKGFKISSRRAISKDLETLLKFFKDNSINFNSEDIIDDYS